MEQEEELKRQLEQVQAERTALEEDRECRRAMQDKADVVRISLLSLPMIHLLPPMTLINHWIFQYGFSSLYLNW